MTQQEINSTSMLRIGTILRGTYRIDSYLSSGGFGNTYIATNIEFDERYAVKEFFMKGVTQRDDNQITVSVSNSENTNSFLEQREKFKKEARRLRQFNNQHIIRVHDMFEENGTAYYVMDYVDGENLSDRLKRTGYPMKESEVNLIFPQILDALKTVHDAGMWHLDLKPANIMLGKDGKIKIIDFGASKQLNVQKGGATTSTAISYTNGYAPREQMEQNYDKFGPWTDLYALGATLYNLLSNRRPPLPTDIDDDMTDDKHLALPLPEDVSAGMKSLVLWLMQTNRMRRPQSIDELSGKLSTLVANTNNIETNYVEEETIIASSKAETSVDTVIETPKEVNVTENNNTYSANNEYNPDIDTSEGNSSYILNYLMVIIGVIVATMFICSIFQCSNDINTNYSAPIENCVTIDSCCADYSTCPDTVPVIVYNTSIGQCKYVGPLGFDNKPDGYGEAFFNDGRYYKGNFESGVLNGKGSIFVYQNGDEFEGEFVNNRFHYGKYTMKSDGSFYVGYFDNNGQPKQGTWYNQNGNVIERVN